MDAPAQTRRKSNRSVFFIRFGMALFIVSIVLMLTMSQQERPLVRAFLFAASFFVATPLAAVALVLSLGAVRRRPLLSALLLPVLYVLVVVLYFGAVLVEAAHRGPYTAWYNCTRKSRAEAAGLVGSSESRVIPVLGNADYVWRYWDQVVMATGLPAPGAVFVTTYNYGPYPGLPFSKFQVHCTGGVVRGVEVFDD